MLTKLVISVFCLNLVLSDSNLNLSTSAKPWSLKPLYNQTVKKLEQLKEILSSSLLESHIQLELLRTKHQNYANQTQTLANTKLEDEAKKITNLLNVMEDIAESSGVNIDKCLQPSTQKLEELLNQTVRNIQTCLGDINKKVNNFISDGSEKIDEPRNQVSDLDLELKRCKTESMLCLAPVVTRIDLFKIELPEFVESETHKIFGLVEPLTVQVDGCSSSNIILYVADAGVVEAQTEECVNRIVPSTLILTGV